MDRIWRRMFVTVTFYGDFREVASGRQVLLVREQVGTTGASPLVETAVGHETLLPGS